MWVDDQDGTAQNFTLVSNTRESINFMCVAIVQHRASEHIYEGKSISNLPIPFPIDRDTHDFHALFQYMF